MHGSQEVGEARLPLPDTRNKKLQTDKVEKKKFNPFLRRHTLHREIK